MRRLLMFALPFGAGTFLCQYVLPGQWLGTASAAALLLGLGLALLLRGRRRVAAAICAFGLAAGIGWFSLYSLAFFAPAEELVGGEDVVTVELTDYAQETAYGRKAHVRVLGRGLLGKAVYYGGEELAALEPGNRLTVPVRYYTAGEITGESTTYYTARGVFLRLYSQGEPLAVEDGRAGALRYLPQRMARRLAESIRTVFSPETAGLIAALLTGEREGLDTQALSDLKASGLMHITAVSGLHCGILIALLGVLLGRRQRLTALVGYPILLFYMVMVGCSPSVVRSCIMAGFLLAAPLAGREGDAPTALGAALLTILVCNPYAVASVSLQLSFAAVAGLLVVTPRVYAALTRHSRAGRRRGKLWRLCSASVAASLGTMAFTAPISAYYFRTLALAAPVSNLLAVWAAPALFCGALLLAVLAIPFPGLGALAFLPEALARYVLGVAGALARVPGQGVHFTGPALGLWLGLVYAMLALCWLSRARARTWAFAALSAAVCLTAARAMPIRLARESAMVLAAVDVGQGAATLLGAGDRAALVDCGSLYTPQGPGNTVAGVMDTYGWRKLDYVALTHYHADHANGLGELLARVEVERLLLPQLSANGGQAALQGEVLALAERYQIPVTYVDTPASFPLGEATLAVYPPLTRGDMNEEGLTVLASCGAVDALITGDMAGRTEGLLTAAYDLPDIELLLVGHHGSGNSTSPALLEAVKPEVGIISVGENTFGHPAPEAMDRMASAGMTLYRTDLQGNVVVRVHQ